MIKYNTIVSATLLVLASLLNACGPSAAFQAASAQGTTSADNAEVTRLRTELQQQREANRQLAIGQVQPGTDAGAHGPVVAGVATPLTQVAPVVAPPQMPPLCAGVDPALINVAPWEVIRTESQGFGGVYDPGGNTVNGHVFLQNVRYWMTIVINDQVQTATTGPRNSPRQMMIIVRHQSGLCRSPAYMPEGARHVRFTPDSGLPGQRLEVRCYVRQMDPTTGTWRPGEYRGHHVWNSWDPADSMVAEMQDGYCGQ